MITTLWIMAILALLAMGIGFRASLEVRLSKYNMDRLQARYLAKAGIAKAKEYLSRDINEKYDTLYECGISLKNEETPETIFGAESNKLGSGSFSVHYTRKKEDEEGEESEEIQYGMIDEERKINIKLSNLEKMANYKEVLKRLSSNFTEDIINAIIDWQDSGDVRLSGGAEGSDYDELGYICKDAEFESVEELLLVKGMPIELLDEIKEYITVYGDGKININTAPREVLNAVINDEGGRYDGLVDSIIGRRKAEDGMEGTSDDGVFNDIGEVLSIAKGMDGGKPGPNFLRLDPLSNHFTFKSSTFRIISHGKVGRVTKVITCVVNKDAEKNPNQEENPIKYYHEE